jgi:hypothetical protein
MLLLIVLFGVVVVGNFEATSAQQFSLGCPAPKYFFDGSSSMIDGVPYLNDKMGSSVKGQINSANSNDAALATGGVGPDNKYVVFSGHGWVTFAPYTTSPAPTSFSVSMWVYLTSYSSLGTLLTHWGNGGHFQFVFDSSQPWGRLRADILTSNYLPITVTSNPSISLNTWTHVAFVYDTSSGTTAMKLYMGGVQVGIETRGFQVALAPGGTGFFSAGARMDSATSPGQTFPGYLYGSVDEILYYTDPLTQAQVASIAAKTIQNGRFPCPVPSPRPTASTCLGPTNFFDSRYNINGGIIEVLDAKNSGTLGKASSSGVVIGTGGVGGDGYYLDFNGNAYVVFSPTSSSIMNSQSFTVSLWVYLKMYTPWATFLKHWTDYATGQFHISLFESTQNVKAYVSQSNGQLVEVGGGTGIPLNVWTHIAFVADPATTTLRLLVNGAQVGSSSYSGSITTTSGIPFFSTGAKMSSQTMVSQDCCPGYLNGFIDEILLYNVALSNTRIQQIASKTVTDGIFC